MRDSSLDAACVLPLPVQFTSNPNAGGPVDRSIQSGSRARLLVIEDADDAREMLKFLLEIKGYVVDTAPDGYEGIALARARSPSAAVIDIGLPGMDGWSVATTLRQEFDDRIRLIAYT